MPAPTPPDPPTDEDLLARLRGGDRAVFGELVRRFERELYGYLRRYVGNDDLADDVFQNTFVAVYRKIGRYEPGRPAKPWVYAIATNQAIDALRRRTRREKGETRDARHETRDGETRSPLDVVPAVGLDPGEAAGLDEERAKVRAAVDRLPDGLKQVVLLAYFQGMKYSDVSAVLDIPVGTVKSRMHAAMAKLSEELGEGVTQEP